MAKQNGEAVKPELGHVKANILSKKKKKVLQQKNASNARLFVPLDLTHGSKVAPSTPGVFLFFFKRIDVKQNEQNQSKS